MPKFDFFKKKSLFSEVVEREPDEEIKRKYDSAKPMFLESQKYFWSHYVPKEVYNVIRDTAKTIDKKEHHVLQRNRLDENIIYHYKRDWSHVYRDKYNYTDEGVLKPELQAAIAEKSFVWTVDDQANSPDYEAIVKAETHGQSANAVYTSHWGNVIITDVTIQYAYKLSDSESSGLRTLEGFGLSLEIGRDWIVLYDYSQDRNLSLPDNKDRIEPDQSHLILRYDSFRAGLLFPGIQLDTVAHFSEWLESTRKETFKKLEEEAQSAFWAKYVDDPRIRDNRALWPKLDEVKFYKEWDAKEKEILENSQADFMGTLRNEVSEMIDSRSYHYQKSSKSQT